MVRSSAVKSLLKLGCLVVEAENMSVAEIKEGFIALQKKEEVKRMECLLTGNPIVQVIGGAFIRNTSRPDRHYCIVMNLVGVGSFGGVAEKKAIQTLIHEGLHKAIYECGGAPLTRYFAGEEKIVERLMKND